MARTYAQLSTLTADLSTEFGREWAIKLFGAEAIASLPVRQVGKNKGTPKGVVIWRKARTPGWCREVSAPLAVGQMADAWIGANINTLRDNAVYGQWLGRSQPLGSSFSAGVFFEEGRAAHAQREARIAADWAAEIAEMREAK